MPTMMSALPSWATSSRIALGRAAAGISRTLAGRSDHRLRNVLQNERVRIDHRDLIRRVDIAGHDVHRPVRELIAGVEVRLPDIVDESRPLRVPETKTGAVG